MPFQVEVPKTIDHVLRIFKSHIDALQRDFSRTFVERAVRYYRYHNEPCQFGGFEWQIDILNDMHPRQVITKRSQVGVTTLMMWKVILFLEQYSLMPFYYKSDTGVEMSLFPTAIYTLESQDKVSEFSSDRLKDFIRENQYIGDLLEDGEIDQISLKKFGRSGLYLGGRRTVSSVTTIPAQLVMADEWDRTEDKNVGEQLEARLKASPMFRAKTQRGMMIKFSTPEMENWGVTKEYEELSDQMTFLIKCSHCEKWEEMIYPDSIAGHYEKGQKVNKDLYYQCLHCHRPLDMGEIGKWNRKEPLKIHNCQWVPARKEYYDTVTRYGEGVRGYKIPWGYSASPYEVMRDRDTKDTLYFHHHTLGIPYTDKKTGLTSEVFRSAENINLRFGYDPGYIHVMGVDQGAYITIWRLLPNTKNNLFPIGRWQVVHAEFCPNTDAFKTFNKGEDGKMYPKKGRVDLLMEQFNIVLCVVDGEPSGNDALNFQGDYWKPTPRVWVNHSTSVNFDDPLLGFKWTDKEKEPSGEEIYTCRIVEDKAGALDAYFNFLYQGGLEIPAHEDEMEMWKQHHLNVKKTITEKQLAYGRKKYETIYYSVGVGDHHCHSSKFCHEAASLYWRLDYMQPSVIISSGLITGTKFLGKRT
jgi:hypothetical protein